MVRERRQVYQQVLQRLARYEEQTYEILPEVTLWDIDDYHAWLTQSVKAALEVYTATCERYGMHSVQAGSAYGRLSAYRAARRSIGFAGPSRALATEVGKIEDHERLAQAHYTRLSR